MKFIDLFSGIGGIRLGLEQAGHECIGHCEFDKWALKSYNAMFSNEGRWCANDIRDVHSSDIPKADLWCFGFPCFVAGTLVKTSNGMVPIEKLNVGDLVLTHKNRFKPVIQTMVRDIENVYKIKAMGCDEIITTENHPFWVRRKRNVWKNETRSYVRRFDDCEWVKAKDLSNEYYLTVPVNQNAESVIVDNLPTDDKDFWWFVGYYLGDGWINRNQVFVAANDKKLAELNEHVNFMQGSVEKQRTCYRVRYCNSDLTNFLMKFGKGASGKCVPQFVIDLNKELLESFIDGYLAADGSFTEGIYKCTTVSRNLAYGIAACVNKVYHRACSVYRNNVNPTTVIEGRTVNQRPQYQMCFNKDNRKQDQAFYEDGFIYVPIRSVEILEEPHKVYNIGVAEDESYTANSVACHNCQDISVAGLQKGLENGKRSGLFFEVMRLLNGLKEDDKPRWLLVENVKNLLSVNKGFDFLRLLCEMEQAGYLCEWQLLNSKDFGVPQNRERVFIVGHLGGKCRREVFPIQGTGGQNPNTLHQIGQSKWVNGTNCQAGRVYDKEGLAPMLKCPTGGGSTPCIIDAYNGNIKTDGTVGTLTAAGGLGLRNCGAFYVVDDSKVGIIDDQGRTNKDLKIYDNCPTLRAQSHGNDPKVIKVLGNYSPSGHTASRVVDPSGLAPTVMENHGTVTATVVKVINAMNDGTVRTITANQAKMSPANFMLQTSRGSSAVMVETADAVRAVLTPDRAEKRQNGRRMKENGEPMFTLTSQDKHGVCLEYGSSYLIRKLTPRECWRLQGFPDEYIDKVKAVNMSDNQMYKQAGNAVTVNVAYAIGKKLKEIEDEICNTVPQDN